jgi:hypothetical protein
VAVLDGQADAEVTPDGTAHGVARHHPQQLALCGLVGRRDQAETIGDMGGSFYWVACPGLSAAYVKIFFIFNESAGVVGLRSMAVVRPTGRGAAFTA